MYLFITPPLDAKETSPRVIARRGGGTFWRKIGPPPYYIKLLRGILLTERTFPHPRDVIEFRIPAPSHTQKKCTTLYTPSSLCAKVLIFSDPPPSPPIVKCVKCAAYS